MAMEVRKLMTNFAKGELSPLIDGRPDLAAFFEGAKTLVNYLVLRQGGVTRRAGTRYVAPVKNHAKDVILLPFESSVGDSYILEWGDQYIRFFTDKEQIMLGSAPYEIASPYTEAQIRNIHNTQSVDIMYLFHSAVAQRKLARVSDVSWLLSQVVFNPPPTFEDDFQIIGGATVTLTPAATTGDGITFTASASVFIAGDVGRLVVHGASSGVITAIGGGGTTATVDIIDAFPDTNPIPSGTWFLRLSPQQTLDIDAKTLGAVVNIVAGGDAFRSFDNDKYIRIYGGLIEITAIDSSSTARGIIVSELVDTDDADPAVVAAGAWQLHAASWSVANGFPRTGEFYQGRLVQAATVDEPNAFWLSVPDDFENYTRGARADDAIIRAIATKQLNRIEWLADNKALYLGTMGSEHRITSGSDQQALGGDVIPNVDRISNYGSSSIQPVTIGNRVVFVDRSARKVLATTYNLETDDYGPVEITAPSEHITEGGIRLGPVALARTPDPRLYYIREDGTLLALTYYYQEKVIGFTRLTTNGTFESVGVRTRSGASDQIWVMVKRTVDGNVRRYIEVFDDDVAEVEGRAWVNLQTDCAKLYDLGGVATTVFTGLSHLEGMEVTIVADGSQRASQVVNSGQITLEDPAYHHVEIGLGYTSTLVTMRPAIEGEMTEGLFRDWRKIAVRLHNSRGGKINGQDLVYVQQNFDENPIYTGDLDVTSLGGYDSIGRITITQDQPYPITILAVFGELIFSDHA